MNRIPHILHAAFWCLVASILVLVWTIPVIPTNDGAAHLYASQALAQMMVDSSSPLHAILQYRTTLTTNVLDHLLIAPLTLFLPGLTAGRVAVSLVILAPAVAIWWAFRTQSDGALMLCPLALPLLLNNIFMMGFYNQQLGLAAVILTVNPWLKSPPERSVRRWLAVSASLFACWACHPVSWAAALGALGLLAWGSWKRVALLALAASPTLAMLGLYVRTQGGITAPPPLFQGNVRQLLVGENPFVTLDPLFGQAALGLLGMILMLAVIAWRLGWTKSGPSLSLLAMATLTAAAWPLAPLASSAGSLIPRRFPVLALAFLLLWLARMPWRERRYAAPAAVMGIAACLLGVVMVGAMASRWHAAQPYYAEYMSMRTHGTFLGLRYERNARDDRGELLLPGLDVFHEAHNWLAVRDGSIPLNNYEGLTSHFPLRYRPGFKRWIAVAIEDAPPCLRLENPGPDQVVLWGYPAQPVDPCSAALLVQLLSHYDVVQRTVPRGSGVVWQRRAGS